MKIPVPARIAAAACLAIALAAPSATLEAAPVPVAPSSIFDLTGFAEGTTGGGVIDENDPAYVKVGNALEFITAIRNANKAEKNMVVPKVIEITADIDLGWNVIGDAAKGLSSCPIRAHAAPKLHPVLIASGVSLIDISPKNGLTIFSASGHTIKHATFNIKGTTNIIIRNLRFDEMWEWDEATKGDYDSNDWDFITLGNGGNTTKIWIDHCTFTKAYDGITDMKAKASGVTYSWCRIEGGDDTPGGFIRQQIDSLETNKSSTTVYKYLRDTANFTPEEIAYIMRGQKKGILMGANSLKSENASLTATFHHVLMTNLWDRAIPRLRGGNVHIYNAILDDTEALAAKRLRDAKAALLTSAQQNTLANTYHFSLPLNGCISTEDGAILLEKSVYTDCLWPLRNNQTDPSNAAYTGKILGLDVIYNFTNTDSTVTTIRGNSTDAGSPLGPFQAATKPFSWNLSGGALPYTITHMDDPATLEPLLQANAGAGIITWSDGDKSNWLKTAYPAAPVVNVAPTIITGPKTQTAVAGSAITLSVLATGSPVLAYQWYFNNIALPGATGSTLTLPNISAADEGDYHVVVSNGIPPDATSAAATITLAPAPLAPVATAATAITATGFTANWTASANATGYSIDVSPDPAFANFWPGCENIAAGNVTSKTITGLNPATTYYYRVRATVGSFATDNSGAITVATSNVLNNEKANDTFSDTDRNSAVASPAANNTMWVTNSGGSFIPSSTGLKWSLAGTSNAMCLGYFPVQTVGAGEANSIKITLNFKTGNSGASANNLRIALVDDTAGGRIASDGFSSSNNAYTGDIGYGVFSGASNIGGGSTVNSAFNTVKRTTTGNNLLGTLGDWTTLASSSDATGYFEANTEYALAITLNYDGATLSIRTQITGGNFSGVDYIATDNATPTLSFNTLSLRFGTAANQFSDINLTGLLITQGTGGIIPALPAIYSASTASGHYGDPFTYTPAATNSPDTFTVTGLPAGLGFDTATGVISGTPSEYGTFNVLITPSNTNGAGAPFTLTLTIAAPPPPAPGSVTAGTPAANGFTVTWAAVDGATSYEIDLSTSADFSSMVSGYDGLDAGNITVYAFSDLDPETTYYCRVRAVIGDVVGANSITITATTPASGGGESTATLLDDSFADGTRAAQNLPSSADWWTSAGSSNFTAVTGAATLNVGSSRTILGYFADAGASPASLAAGESLKLEFVVQFTGFDTAAAETATTLAVGLLRSVANPDAVAGTGFVPAGTPNTNARVSGDFGSSNPTSNVFNVYTGYTAFTRARDAANDTPVTFRARNLEHASLLGGTGAYTAIADTETPVASTAMAANTDYRGTFILARTDTGGMTLSFEIAKASDNSVVMTHTAEEAAATFTGFDTVAFYLSKAGASAAYDFVLKNITVTKTAAAGGAPSAPTNVSASGATANGFTAQWSAVDGATGYYLDVSTDPAFGSFVSGYNNLSLGNVTSHAVTGLAPGVTYYYRIRAANNSGSSASSASGTITTTAAASYIANDTFSDNDRIGGTDGSAPVRNGPPFTSAPTPDNTQWVSSSTNTKLVATGAGMTWNFTGSPDTSVIIMGYYPEFTIQPNEPVTVALAFKTGGLPADVAPSNIRFALVDDKSTATPAERLNSDLTTSSDDRYKNNTGYAFYTASNVAANGATDVLFTTGKRNATGIATNNLLNSTGHWDTLGDSAGETGYFEADTAYTMTFTLAYDGAALAITTRIQGGKFSEAGNDYSYTVTDSASPNLTFNTLAIRIAGLKMFSNINFTGLKIWEGDEPVIGGSVPVISSPATATGMVGSAFSYSITASGSPASYALAGGSLPAGVTLDTATGLISGTPTESGTFNVTLTATNATGTSTPHALAITIAPAIIEAPVITSAATATATVGSAFSYNITASNQPGSFAATGLPASLTLNTTTGVISGTPVTGDLGTHLVTLTATNVVGASLPFSLTITVELPPALSAPVASAASGVMTTSFIARWESVDDANNYVLDVATDPGFTSFVPGYNALDAGAIAGCYITGLAADTNYYYRVRAVNEAGPSASSAAITVRTAAAEVVLVDDSFTDTDRIGGNDGSSTSSTAPRVNAATSTNTQWVIGNAGQLVATGTGMNWNFLVTGAVSALGYFPAVNVANGTTVTLQLEFTTGTLGTATSSNNFRIVMIDSSPNGYRETDGAGASADPFVGDKGYAFFMPAPVAGASTTPVTLQSYKRTGLTSDNLFGSDASWTRSKVAQQAAGHYFASNTTYKLTIALTRGTATSITASAVVSGGNFDNLVCEITDADQPVTRFDTLGLRFGAGINQFNQIKLNSLKISTTGSAEITEPPVITSALTAGATRGADFTYTIAAENVPTSFSAAGLPSGLELNESTGVISGAPTVTGTFTVTIAAHNAIGSDSRELILTVAAGESDITTVVPPGGGLTSPASTVFDASGNAYIADIATGTIQKVAPGGAVTTFATIPQLAVLAIDTSGNIYTAGNDGNVRKVLADGTVASPALATGITAPGGIAVASDGAVYVSKTDANTIVKITSAGAVSTFAGSGAAGSADATGASASFNGPTGLAINASTGKLYVADTVNCTIREIDLATAAVATVAGQPGVTGDTGSEGADGKAADGALNTPEAIAVDAAGLLYIADTGNDLIRGFDPVSGALTTLAGDSGSTTLDAPAGLAFDPTSGILHVADTGNGAFRAITFKPVIAARIVDRIAPLGSTVTLDGTAWTSPAAAYTWHVHDNATTVGTDTTLTITVNSVTDSGVYTISAANAVGTTSASMRLTVTGNGSTSGPDVDSPGMNSSGGGGGAPSFWILGAMALLLFIRKFSARRRAGPAFLPMLFLLSLFTLHSSPLAPSLFAQQAPAAAAADDEPAGDEVITMSAFEVTGQSVKGYTASESVTGTRVASLLRDLPFNVNVVTEEFIADFNALELSDQLSNVSSFSPSENIGQFQLRGFEASTQLVDGFRRVGLTGVTVTDRVEVIKGPAASIYGAIQPGGAVNTLRKKPSSQPKYGLTAGFGTHDQSRASLYASGPVGNSSKLFYRLDTEYRTADRQQEFAMTRNQYIAAQLMYKPTSRTTLAMFIDHAFRFDRPSYQLATSAARVDISNLPSWFPYSTDGLRRTWAKYFTQYFGQDYDYYDMNFFGPNAEKYSRLTSGSITLDHKINAHWTMRASFNISTNPTHTENSNIGYYPFGYGVLTADTVEPPQAEVRMTPKYAETTNKSTGFQIDNLFRFDTGPIKHQLLITGDYYRNSSREFSATWSQAFLYDPTDPYGLSGRYPGWDYATWDEDPAPYNRVSDNSKVINRNYGLFVSERATMFKGRLIAMAGVRYDYVDCTATHMPTDDNYVTQVVDYSPDSWTFQLGLTAVLNRYITAYANASSAFDPQPQLDEYDNPLPNKESDGYEFGLKLNLLSEKLSITLNRFHIRQENLTYSVNDPETGQKETIVTGEQVAKGYEIDFNWQVSRSLNIVGGYGYVDAEITDAGKLNWLNNTTPRRVPKHNLGISLRYEFVNGPLKGLFATAGATYYSRSLVNAGSGYNITPYKGTEDFARMSQELIYNVRFPNGGLPYPYLPENAIVSYFTPATSTSPAMLYWTDNQNATTAAELKKYSYADPYLNGAVYVIDGRTQIYNPSSVVWKMGIGYKFKGRAFGKRLSHKIQVNVGNVFNEKSTLAGGIPILERNAMVTYSVSY